MESNVNVAIGHHAGAGVTDEEFAGVLKDEFGVEKTSHELINDLRAGRKVFNGGVTTLLEKLESARKHWESHELAASHGKLYEILRQCYSFYLTMKDPKTAKEKREQMDNELSEFIKARGFRTQKDTHGINRVVKAVFGEDRRRVSSYASALRIALTAGARTVDEKPTPIAPDALRQWFMDFGGIEEVRKMGAKGGGMKRDDKISAARAAVKDSPLMTFKPDSKTMAFGTNDGDQMMLLVVTYRPTGELEVNSIVRGESPLNAALAAYYAKNKDELAKGTLTSETRQSALAIATKSTI